MELAVNEKTKNAKRLSKNKWELVILPEKNKGANTKRFFTHCSTLINFK